MADIINNIKLRFRNGDILIKLIFINIGVFIILGIMNVISTLFKFPIINLTKYLGIPAWLEEAFTHPWTFFTYMFVHVNLFHILFNMLILYWFGKIFLTFFSQRNLGGLYILGGLGGAILYLLAFNTIPYYMDMRNAIMIGASASVTAIIFASAFYRPNTELHLLIFGRIKILYIALFIFVIDFLALGSPENPGGHIAHIGGAIAGFIFAKQYLKGKDITRWMNSLIDKMVNLFKPKQRSFKVKTKPSATREADYEYNAQKKKQEANIDKILDKIKASGYSSLTKEEKKRLFDASNK